MSMSADDIDWFLKRLVDEKEKERKAIESANARARVRR
jgi:hypothetical protein